MAVEPVTDLRLRHLLGVGLRLGRGFGSSGFRLLGVSCGLGLRGRRLRFGCGLTTIGGLQRLIGRLIRKRRLRHGLRKSNGGDSGGGGHAALERRLHILEAHHRRRSPSMPNGRGESERARGGAERRGKQGPKHSSAELGGAAVNWLGGSIAFHDPQAPPLTGADLCLFLAHGSLE